MDQRTFEFNNSRLTIKFGNILDSEADVIVSSDDYFLTMGGGVSACIWNAVGETIKKETKKHIPARIGDVVVTSAGSLKMQKYIFHCITIGEPLGVFSGNLIDMQEYIIKHSVDKCFRLLQALDLNSIAFPSIGAGAAGIPLERVAKMMSEAISDNLNRTNKVFKVELFLFDRFHGLFRLDYRLMFDSFAALSAQSAKLRLSQGLMNLGDNHEDKLSDKSGTINNAIFISYSQKDLSIAEEIINILEANGYTYWIDKKGIYSGENYKEMIVNAIDSSVIVIYLSSQNSNGSKTCMQELSYAFKTDKKVIPILLDDSPYPKSLVLDFVNVEFIDFRNKTEAEKKLKISIEFNLRNN